MNQGKYVIANDISKATHWLATEDKAYPEAMITTGKLYPLLCFIPDKGICIKDDDGVHSSVLEVHNGQYVSLYIK